LSLDLFRLNRPEYTRQPESLVTDLVWGTLDEPPGPDGGRPYLLPRLDKPMGKYVGPEGSLRTATDAIGSGGIFSDPGPAATIVLETVFEALFAPRARGSRLGDALVMVNPDFAALQNLRGFTSKNQPPSYHKIFERIARLGGSGEGGAARLYLESFADAAPATDGATGFIETGLSTYSARAFEACFPGSTWKGAAPSGKAADPSQLPLASHLAQSPFAWFWEKWTNLHEGGWRGVLPARRFADWQSSIARTGLAMSYLYEARVLCILRDALAERAAGKEAAVAAALFSSHFGQVGRPVPLGRIYGPEVDPGTKGCGPWLNSIVKQGVSFLAAAKEAKAVPAVDWAAGAPGAVFTAWLEEVPPEAAQRFMDDAQALSSEGKNLFEFVKHLLKPLEDRTDDSGFGERADLYGLLKQNSAGKIWFEPGPEWLVPVVSLLSGEPGGEVTLKAVRADLAKLGLECDRAVLVSLLEACGLTTDSPDADDGLVVRSGF
jgi:hypothetical protein